MTTLPEACRSLGQICITSFSHRYRVVYDPPVYMRGVQFVGIVWNLRSTHSTYCGCLVVAESIALGAGTVRSLANSAVPVSRHLGMSTR